MAAKPRLKRKSYFVDERALSRAKKALGAKTEAEAIRLSVERCRNRGGLGFYEKISPGAQTREHGEVLKLIVLTARRHGATVVTVNSSDFELLRTELRISVLPAQ